MLKLKKLICIILAAALSISITACNGSSTADALIKFEINSIVKNIDPQLASSPSELLIVRNIFEGLFRYDNERNLVPAAAKSYTLSDDGFTYTFHLSNELVWCDGSPLKAKDFEFGIKRAANPALKSPHSYLLSGIKYADEILAGNRPYDELAVRALDDYTLEVTLEKPNNNFLKLLANPVFMPCSQQFFEKSAGKYGLSTKTILSNGPFYIKSWDLEAGNIRLNRCGQYKGNIKALPSGVIIYTKSQTSTLIERFKNKEIDIAELNFSLIERLEGSNTVEIYDTCFYLLINPNSNIGSSLMRQALAASIHRNAYTNEMPNFFKRADYHIPPDYSAANKKISDIFSFVYPIDYDPIHARQLFLEAISKLLNKKFPSTTLLCIDDPAVKTVATSIVQRWQQDLGAFININFVDINKMKSQVRSGDYHLALYPVSSADDSAVNLLKKFTSNSPNNFYGFSNAEFDTLVNSLDAVTGQDELIQKVIQAQQLLFECNTAIPIFFAPRIFTVNSNIVNFSPDLKSGNIDFAYIGKKSTIR